MDVYVCIYTCVCVHLCICERRAKDVYACTIWTYFRRKMNKKNCRFVKKGMKKNVCTYIYMWNIYMYIYICTYVNIYVYIYLYMYIYICVCTYIHLHLYTYIYIYLYMWYICISIFLYLLLLQTCRVSNRSRCKWESNVAHINKSCRTSKSITMHIRISHVAREQPCTSLIIIRILIWESLVAHIN